MNREAVFNHFSKIIDNMLDNSLFFETFWQRPYSEDSIEGSIDDVALPENINLFFGASRGCIFDTNYNYVVKFDIEGDYFNDSLCQREIDIFRAAKANCLDAYFAEPTYLGVYERTIYFYDIDTIEQHLDWYGYEPNRFDDDFAKVEDSFGPIVPITIVIPLYAYPKADKYIYTSMTDEESSVYSKQAKSVNSPLRQRHMQIALEFIFRYGMEQYQKISEFMKDYNINDLHFGNIGQINGNLVCIDFAGYHNGYSTCSSYT